MQNLKFRLGVNRFEGVLFGRMNRYNIEKELTNNEYFASLGKFSPEHVTQVINRLIEYGFINRIQLADYYGNDAFVLEISQLGVNIMKTGEMPFSEQVIVSRVISIDGNDLELFDHLRKIRITLAKEEKLPPFTICNDEALLAISKIKPTKVEDLVRIKGIGPRFIEKRSRLFLDEVKSFLNTHEIIEDESSESWDINSLNDELSKKSGVFFVDDPVEINSTPDQEKLFSNQGKPWSKKLDLELSESFKRGKTISELSKQFKRSSGGIRSRLVKMGLIENTGYPTETEK
jgi:hypothetical protein